MKPIRRVVVSLSVAFLGVSIGAFLSDQSAGQPVGKKALPAQPTPPPVSTGSAANFSSIKIIEDTRYRQIINVGRDCIKDKEWKQAVEALQAVLNEKKDSYVQVHEQDPIDPRKETSRWTSVKFEANNLLGSMPVDGLEQYEQSYGAEAKGTLAAAKQNGDSEAVAEISQRYCHTKAGIEANEIVATLYLARGQVFPAALRFEKLLQMNAEWAKLSDLTLFKATIAFRRAGDTKNYEETWKRLQANLGAKQSLKVGDDNIPVAKLEEVLKETAVVDIVNQHDWPMAGGNNMRTAQAIGSPPLLDAPLWKRPLFKDVIDGFKDEDKDQVALDRTNKVIKAVGDANQPVLPGGFPIASQGVMVYRSPRDVRAIALKDMEIRTEEGEVVKYKPGELLWKSIVHNRSIGWLLEKTNTQARLDPWLDSYHKVTGFDSFLYDNTTVGTLATDHRYVYAINDLVVPPHPGMFMPQNFGNPNMQIYQAQELKPLIMQNELCAYDLINGKMKWDLNGEDAQFKDSHFISLPIAVGGKLYVLNERLTDPNAPVAPNPFGMPSNPIGGESEIRLVCIDPTKIVMINGNPKPHVLDPIQPIGNVHQFNRYVQDLPRRVNAVHLAYGEGVLICPTNAGEVFGIDLAGRVPSLIWSFPYRETEHQMIILPGMNFNPNFFPGGPKNPKQISTTTIVSKWKSSPPAIQDGRIVFTAPDADSVHCVNLRDGKPVWKRGQQKGDLYMAGVYQGRVLIVSDSKIRALDIKDGSVLWSIATNDLPSGQGVASKGIYYLPLKKGEILAIDIVKGEIKAHNRSATPSVSPGNLVFYEGMVLSQTPTEVMAYPQLTARLDIAKKESVAEPNNLTKLTEYGDLLLKDGQVHTAVETLLKVFDRKPDGPLGKRVAARLFEALTDLMQVDFPKASKDYLTIYETLTKVPDNDGEEQNRKAKFFRLVGQGREAQGDLVTAFQMYKEFGALPIYRNDGIPSPDDPNQKIPINVWLRGRISGMIAHAKPNEKAPLEAKIAEEWSVVRAKKDEGAIRSFVGMFDVPFKVGREARVQLAESIMDRNDRASFLEAELYLYQVVSSEYRNEAETGGRALAALAQLEALKGSIDSVRLAAAYYRQLARDFPNTPVRGVKTGTDLVNELATDKRFLAFLESSSGSWGHVKTASRELPGGSFPNAGMMSFVMQPDGDRTPFATQHRLVLNPSNAVDPRLALRDLSTGENRWDVGLGRVDMNQQIFWNLYQQQNMPYRPSARFHFYQVKGHLMVCQVGVMVYGFDGDTGKELWKYQTAENVQQQNGFFQPPQVLLDSEGNPELHYRNQLTNQVVRVPMGRVGAVQASYVAILGHKGLTVRDPVRGTEMWRKTEVPDNSHVFGDDQYVFLVDVNGAGVFGAGRTIRASDGETQNVKDFSNVYQSRIHVYGRQILAAQASPQGITMRLYDIPAAKDIWSKMFPVGSYVMRSDDESLAGIVELNGKTTILDSKTGNVLAVGNVAQYRVAPQELNGLSDVLLLQDADHYYIALNRPLNRQKVVVNNQTGKPEVYNNFTNGTHCHSVNGWFVALHKTDGQRTISGKDVKWSKGDMAWHSQTPIENQMIVLEQFEQMPVVLFSSRYNEIIPNNGGLRWPCVTQALSKASGLWVHDSTNYGNSNPWYSELKVDLKSRTINLVSSNKSVQVYVDDGKGPPAFPQGAFLQQPNPYDPTSPYGAFNPYGQPPVAVPPINGLAPGARIMRAPVPRLDVVPVDPKKRD